MHCFSVTLKQLSAFATSFKGDTLFGQLCWAINNRLGETQLQQCLDGYHQDQPFAVLSDAFPEGYLPLPKLPSSFYQLPEGQDRKAVKKRAWLPDSQIQAPVEQWLGHAVNGAKIASTYPANKHKANIYYHSLSEQHPQPHNTINRNTNTTGEGGFAPYSVEQEWFIPGLRWTVYVLLDTDRLNAENCQQCLTDIGLFGYGKDASIGMGKYEIIEFKEHTLPAQSNANACLTLAPCAPQGKGYDSQRSYYQPFTRFGRHGDAAVHQKGKPFKNPVLLAQTAAVFTTQPPVTGFIGQGIGGNGELSKTISGTVQQGYAPVIAINLPSKERL